MKVLPNPADGGADETRLAPGSSPGGKVSSSSGATSAPGLTYLLVIGGIGLLSAYFARTSPAKPRLTYG